jgi:hypothetical protein
MIEEYSHRMLSPLVNKDVCTKRGSNTLMIPNLKRNILKKREFQIHRVKPLNLKQKNRDHFDNMNITVSPQNERAEYSYLGWSDEQLQMIQDLEIKVRKARASRFMGFASPSALTNRVSRNSSRQEDRCFSKEKRAKCEPLEIESFSGLNFCKKLNTTLLS